MNRIASCLHISGCRGSNWSVSSNDSNQVKLGGNKAEFPVNNEINGACELPLRQRTRRRADGPVYEAVTRRQPTREPCRQPGLVPVRSLVQSLLLAAGPVARGTLIECSPFTHRSPRNGLFPSDSDLYAGNYSWR